MTAGPLQSTTEMENENLNAEMQPEPQATLSCPSCRTTLARGMRFCRMCGYRLGEGVEEFAETRRFDAGGAAPAGSPFQMPHAWGAVAPAQAAPLAPHDSTTLGKVARACNPLRFGWLTWLVLAFVLLTAGGIAVKMARDGGAFGGRPAVAAHRSFLGVDGFETADGGGAMIEGIAAPDTPVERAGLIGGDIITSFDGRPVGDADDARRALAATPPGRQVEVVFLRDGQEKRAVLTVGTERDGDGWSAIDRRPGGKGRLGMSDYDRVRVPGQNIYGVSVGEVELNQPADLYGIKEGDIITDFDGAPVRTPGDLRYRVSKAEPGKLVKVVVFRGAERLELEVKVGRSK